MRLTSSFIHFASDIKLAHSIFALPFAACGLLFTSGGHFTVMTAVSLLVCMVSARSFAMGMNRYLDRDVDALNPRTAKRMIPAGHLKASASLFWSLCFAFVFVASAFSLNPFSGSLSFLVLALLAAYPFMKRLSWLTHWYLGFCLGMAPMGVSVALSGSLNLPVVLLGLAVMMWTAGFDILYALQDVAFDRQHALQSVPGLFGVERSLWISRLSFAVMIASLIIIGRLASLGWAYHLGILVVSIILFYEQWLVKDSREGKISPNIGMAFFNANGYVSVLFYLFTQLEYYLKWNGL